MVQAEAEASPVLPNVETFKGVVDLHAGPPQLSRRVISRNQNE